MKWYTLKLIKEFTERFLKMTDLENSTENRKSVFFFLPEPVSVYLRINKVFVSYFYNSCLGNLKHTDRDAGIYEACTPRL